MKNCWDKRKWTRACIQRMEKILFSQVSVCSHQGGVPQSQVLSQVTGPRSFLGYPSPGGGYPSLGSGGTPVLSPQPDQDGVPPNRTERALATRRPVYRLCSRRRTFLFYSEFLLTHFFHSFTVVPGLYDVFEETRTES